MPDGAEKWQIISSVEPIQPPYAEAVFGGIDYEAGNDIDVSDGKVWIALAATDGEGRVVGFAQLKYNETVPNSDIVSLLPIHQGDLFFSLQFDVDLSSETKSISTITDLVNKIEINPDDIANYRLLSISSESVIWDSMTSSFMVMIPTNDLSDGDVVRVTFKSDALIDADNGPITQESVETTVIGLG